MLRRKLLDLGEVAEHVVYVFEMMVLLIPHMYCVASFEHRDHRDCFPPRWFSRIPMSVVCLL